MANQVRLGTSAPIFIARGGGEPVRSGRDYFFVQIAGAQATFAGSIWERVKNLIVVSQVDLNHTVLGSGGVKAIQRLREVKHGRAEQLGLSTNLVELVPAVMSHVSLSIEFILDKESRLAPLTSLINDNNFLAAVSLAPGAAIVAKTVSGLAQKVVETFLAPEQREPILQFSGDFNIASNQMREGYYAILGSRDENKPLPSAMPQFTVENGTLEAAGSPVTDFSYVILDVQHTEARTRDLNDGAPWESKLREAEDEAKRASEASTSEASTEDRDQAWKNCVKLIHEAQVLLRADINFLRWEAEAIVNATFKTCKELISPSPTRGKSSAAELLGTDSPSYRAVLGISADEDLGASFDRYANSVASSRRILRTAGLIKLN